MILRLDGEMRVVMEATGVYHLPILFYLREKEIFVSVINPFEIKEYASRNLRQAKTDKQYSITISNYGVDNWFRLKDFEASEELYSELKLLRRQYRYYMELHVKSLQELTHLLDYVTPRIKGKLNVWNKASGKDKLSNFIEKY